MAKYGPLAAGVSSQFRAAVIERFGACSDSLVGFISMLCGDGHRDALRADDYTFSASSRTTYMAVSGQRLPPPARGGKERITPGMGGVIERGG